jgi:BirA family biotin operon repressor/biotin-[acetyl-CoA-carboxylase] ligase
MSQKYRLIRLLSDGEFHSGQELGEILAMTRGGIWKAMQQLSPLGIEVERVKGKGYRIPRGIELLQFEKIYSHIPETISKQINLQIFDELDSTNQYLVNHQSQLPSGTIVFAEHQTQGRGRRQKKWLSPFGANLYCSILYHVDKDPSELNGLSLATGVAVTHTLENYGIPNVQLKWPNDILWQNKKISGILIEMSAETNSRSQVIIGIGLNVSMPSNSDIDQEWIDVATITGQKPERNRLAAYLIIEVVEMLQRFQQKGLSNFIQHWKMLDAYFDKAVTLQTPTQQFNGIAKGINQRGEFILLEDNNKERHFMHGEVSLRLAKK